MSSYEQKIMRLLINLLKLCLCAGVFLQSASAWQTTQINHNFSELNLGAYLEYYEDASAKLTLEEILSPEYIYRFTPSRQAHLRFGYTQSAYWLRFSLKNATQTSQRLILDFLPAHLGSVILFELSSHERSAVFQAKTAGSQTNTLYGDIKHQTYLFQLTLAADEQKTFYARVSSDQHLNLEIWLKNQSNFIETNNRYQLFYGVGLGILIALIAYHLFLWLSIKQLSYFYFSGYTLAITGFLFTNRGYHQIFVQPPPGLQNRLEAFFITTAILCGLLFSRSFLQTTRQQGSYYDKLIVLLIAISFNLWTIQHALPIHIVTQASSLLAFIVEFALLTIACALLHQQGRPLIYYFVSRIFQTSTFALSMLTVYGSFSFSIPIPLLIFIACVADPLLISLGLADQFRSWRTAYVKHQSKTQEIKERAKAQNAFIRQISHEIRTPMSGILGMSELLNATALTTQQTEFINTIRSSGIQLLGIIDDISDYVKINSGELLIQKAPFDLNEVITQCIEKYLPQLEEKKIELLFNVREDTPTQLVGDANRIIQVISNLLAHFIKFTESGEMTLGMSLLPANRLRVVIKNSSGHNFPQAHLARLETVSLQSMLNQPGHYSASLLGLSIAKHILSLLGGSLETHTDSQNQSSVSFTIPVELQKFPVLSPYKENARLNQYKILIIDDSASCRTVIEQYAQSWGMQTDTAVHGKQALAQLRTQALLNDPFDIIVVDHDMPGMSGLEFAEKVKDDSLVRSKPVIILLTGLAFVPSKNLLKNTGITTIVMKPISGKQLKQTLVQAIEQCKYKRTAETRSEEALTV